MHGICAGSKSFSGFSSVWRGAGSFSIDHIRSNGKDGSSRNTAPVSVVCLNILHKFVDNIIGNLIHTVIIISVFWEISLGFIIHNNAMFIPDTALKEAGVTIDKIDAIAFTRGPGLLGSLLVGVSFAKGLSISHDIPLVEVNHLQGHILSHFLDLPDRQLPHPDFPFLCLLVSGGHTQIVKVDGPLDMQIVGTTIDDAAGEAFDKCAKVMGLPYPGGPVIDKLAKEGDPHAFRFAKPRIEGFDYSFSGLKTSFLYTLRDEMAEDPNFIEKNKADLCASLQTTIVEILLDKLVKASKEYGIRDIAIAGGVSANSGLRNGITEEGRKRGWRTFLPEFKFTTDNAAMIALAGYYRYMNGNIATLDIAPVARLEELELTVAPTAEQ